MSFARRAHTEWQLRTASLHLGARTVVMGILNVTPDSFSDGGRFSSVDEAVASAAAIFADGAAVVDVGGESTRPGAQPLDADAEAARVLPVIEGILQAIPGARISVDTYHAATARAAIAAGAEIVNDVSGLLWDESMASACAELSCGVVLAHTRGRPSEWKSLPPLQGSAVVPLVRGELAARARAALRAGIAPQRLLLDPGFGFGKAFDANYPLLAQLSRLRSLGFPLLAGVSRKAFLGRALAPFFGGKDAPVEARGNATVAAVTAAILSGADVVRVHDVRAAVEAAAVADSVLAAAQ